MLKRHRSCLERICNALMWSPWVDALRDNVKVCSPYVQIAPYTKHYNCSLSRCKACECERGGHLARCRLPCISYCVAYLGGVESTGLAVVAFLCLVDVCTAVF
eukprot:4693520-Amphidinium_carterae.1